MRLATHLSETVSRLCDGKQPLALGVAVSGGSDSLALLDGLVDWAKSRRGAVFAATVDHGLRDGSRAEAEAVASFCEQLGVAHRILTWEEAPTGNLQNAARVARYDLLAQWAREEELPAVALGHTLDDQAETFLMRLARGSGVDGLAGMAERRVDRGVTWLRPLLSLRRSALREHLENNGINWIDDPSNEDHGLIGSRRATPLSPWRRSGSIPRHSHARQTIWLEPALHSNRRPMTLRKPRSAWTTATC